MAYLSLQGSKILRQDTIIPRCKRFGTTLEYCTSARISQRACPVENMICAKGQCLMEAYVIEMWWSICQKNPSTTLRRLRRTSWSWVSKHKLFIAAMSMARERRKEQVSVPLFRFHRIDISKAKGWYKRIQICNLPRRPQASLVSLEYSRQLSKSTRLWK